jgi:hypothetical protein
MRRIPRRIRRRLGGAAAPGPRQQAFRKREDERARMLDALTAGGACAEIGTWKGDFAAVILEHRRPSRLYLVDPWEHREEGDYEGASYGGRMEGGQAALDEMHRSVAARFAEEVEAGRVEILRRRSVDAAGAIADESLDWVYIDGDHSYAGVKADLEAWFRTVKPGGAMAGDDYGHTGSWFGDGVKRAVDEFAPRCAGLEVIGTQFLLRKGS